MSLTEKRHEAQRWLKTAQQDLQAARVLQNADMHAHACFQSQQSAEKAIKAVWYHTGRDPWGHSIQKLVHEAGDIFTDASIREASAALDRFYIPARYPNGLPDLTPGETFFRRDSELAITTAEKIVQYCRNLIETS